MTSVLIVQNTKIEGSGNLGKLLESDGFSINTVYAKKEPITTDSHDMLVILGGPQSANDDSDYLNAEQSLIKQYVKQKKPVLGICLGSQLIAKAFGAKVLRGSKTEIGFYDDIKLDVDSNLFAGFTNPFWVFHWHSDTFELPQDAVRLAYSKQYANQAFQIGSAVGVQFHFEVNRNMINLWLDNTKDSISKIPYIDPQKIRTEIDENISKIESNMSMFYRNFKKEFSL